MSTTNRKNRSAIKFNSGSGVYAKDGITDFENFGEVLSAKLVRKSDTQEVTFMNGEKLKKRGARECTISVVLGQTNKTIQDRIDALLDKTIKFYIDNGVADGKRQGYYFPEIEIVDSFEIEMAGGKPQQLGLEINVLPQPDNVSVTNPSTEFPSEFSFEGTTAVSGTNKFYCIVEEAV